jgi:hypothetical protein
MESCLNLYIMLPSNICVYLNAKLDHKKKAVVEILTEEEYIALEGYWPDALSTYVLRFVFADKDSRSESINGNGDHSGGNKNKC